MLAFGMFLFVSIFFVVLGIISWRSEKPVRFWNISQEIQASDIKKYNRAVSKMWFVFAVYLAAAGLPVLAGQNNAWIVWTILGSMFGAIALMIVYVKIEKKYRIYE